MTETDMGMGGGVPIYQIGGEREMSFPSHEDLLSPFICEFIQIPLYTHTKFVTCNIYNCLVVKIIRFSSYIFIFNLDYEYLYILYLDLRVFFFFKFFFT